MVHNSAILLIFLLAYLIKVLGNVIIKNGGIFWKLPKNNIEIAKIPSTFENCKNKLNRFCLMWNRWKQIYFKLKQVWNKICFMLQ